MFCKIIIKHNYLQSREILSNATLSLAPQSLIYNSRP